MSNQNSSPFSPCSAKAGARRRLFRKRALPWPPRPPRAAIQRSPAAARSATTTPSALRTTVPMGTGTSRSEPDAPCFFFPIPCVPLVAARWGWSRKPSREAWLWEATSQTSPAAAAVAAVGTALGDVGLAPERHSSRHRRHPL